jgi:hypothetical protein
MILYRYKTFFCYFVVLCLKIFFADFMNKNEKVAFLVGT